MASYSVIQVEEFSTGIVVGGTPENWFSKGFTGSYMNKTAESIPYVIERSIANHGFDVSAGLSPCVVGRLIEDPKSDLGYWGVVAIVSRIKDEFGRELDVTRYIYSEGKNSLAYLCQWLDSRQSDLPVFNPLETTKIGKNLYIHQDSMTQISLNESDLKLIDATETSIILAQKINLRFLNLLAEAKSDKTNSPVSWVYNAYAVHSPRNFGVIVASRPEDYESIKKSLVLASRKHLFNVDEKCLKQTVKAIADEPKVSKERLKKFIEYISEIETKVENPEALWNSVFNSLGADKVLNMSIFTPFMTKLLTLRVFVLPNTLPELIDLLMSSKDCLVTSLEFQDEIYQIPIDEKHEQVLIDNVLHSIYYHEKEKEIFAQLFSNTKMLSGIRESLIKRIQDLIISLERCSTGSLYQSVMKYKRHGTNDAKCVSIAEFLWTIKEFDMSLCFYQIARGSVNAKVFNKYLKIKKLRRKNKRYIDICGILVTKEDTLWDRICRVFSVKLPISLVIVVLLFIPIFIFKNINDFNQNNQTETIQLIKNPSHESQKNINKLEKTKQEKFLPPLDKPTQLKNLPAKASKSPKRELPKITPKANVNILGKESGNKNLEHSQNSSNSNGNQPSASETASENSITKDNQTQNQIAESKLSTSQQMQSLPNPDLPTIGIENTNDKPRSFKIYWRRGNSSNGLREIKVQLRVTKMPSNELPQSVMISLDLNSSQEYLEVDIDKSKEFQQLNFSDQEVGIRILLVENKNQGSYKIDEGNNMITIGLQNSSSNQ